MIGFAGSFALAFGAQGSAIAGSGGITVGIMTGVADGSGSPTSRDRVIAASAVDVGRAIPLQRR